MNVRLTKFRLAVAAGVLVLAGAGASTALSPLVGSALATAGQIVNISDPSAAYTARVDSSGALKTAGYVSGTVAPALPRYPFRAAAAVLETGTGNFSAITKPTSATLAISEMSFTNEGPSTVLWLYVRGQSSTTSCDTSSASTISFRLIGRYLLGAGQTIAETFPTPLVLKPLSTGPAYCLIAETSASTYNVLDARVTGFVPAGTYSGAT